MSKFTVLCLFFLPLASFANEFRYEIRHYPPSGDCHQVAAALASKVSEHLKQPAVGRCVDVEKSGFRMEVRYQSDEELPIQSTFSPWTLIYDYSDYATEDECKRALPAWISNYVRNTQIQPLVAYCYNSHSAPGFRLNWAVRIDGIGEPVKRPVAVGLLIHGRPLDYSSDSFASVVRRELEPVGIEFAHSRFLYRAREYQLDLVYYTDGPALSSRRTATFLRKDDCDRELKEVQGLYSQIQLDPAFLFCTENYVHAIDLMAIHTGPSPRTWFAAERMKTYRECAQRKDELIQAYKSAGSPDILGGICSLQGAEFKVLFVAVD